MNRQLHISLRALCRLQHSHQCSYYSTRSALKIASSAMDGEKVGRENILFEATALDTIDGGETKEHLRRQIKVDTFLASLRTDNIVPSIEDIERFKPKQRPLSDSPQYPTAYNNLLERLCKSFTKEQLRRLGELYGLERKWTRRKRRIADYAEAIMEKQWGWENLRELERRKRDATETTTRCTSVIFLISHQHSDRVSAFLLTASELFVLMGKGEIN